MATSVRVNIYNQSFSLVTNGPEGELEALAHKVDELMHSIAKGANTDAARVAILACLHLADELRTAEGTHRKLSRLIEETLGE